MCVWGVCGGVWVWCVCGGACVVFVFIQFVDFGFDRVNVISY